MKKKPENIIGKVWYFIWHDDSILSWIVNIILAFILIKFIVYPGLGLIVGSDFPVVAVVSGSMYQGLEQKDNLYEICGNVYTSKEFRSSFEKWWDNCGHWYLENTNITLEDFESFPLKNGFAKGDIIILKSAKDIKIGDIIVFEASRSYPIIHRVIQISEETNTFNKSIKKYTTKGDHNPGVGFIDTNITQEKIYGKALFKIPYLGYVKILAVDALNFIGF
jgi:signal peptidase I